MFLLAIIPLQMGTGVHREASSASTESVSLGAVLASVAIFAVQLVLVLCAVCGVEHLAAHSAFEASFVPFVSTGDSLLGGVHRLAALGALGVLSWLERHPGCFLSLLYIL